MKRIKAAVCAMLTAGMLFSSCGDQGELPLADMLTLPEGQNLSHAYLDATRLSAAPGMHIAMVVMDKNDVYWEAVEEGAQRAVELINYNNHLEGDDALVLTVDGAKQADDVNAQINAIDSLVAENPSAICIAALDMASCEPQLKAAKDSGIPVIMMDSGVESDLGVAFCGTDNRAAGALAAEKLCEAVGDAGEVVIVTHGLSAQTARDRLAGIEGVLAEHSGIRVSARVEQEADVSTEEQLKAILTENPSIRGIVCTSEATSEAAIMVLRKLQLEDVGLVGFDSGKKQLSAIRQGEEYGLVSQDPRAIGYASVTAAMYAATGAGVDPRIRTGFLWIDQENVNTLDVLPYLYD